jgi:hypothetical protein
MFKKLGIRLKHNWKNQDQTITRVDWVVKLKDHGEFLDTFFKACFHIVRENLFYFWTNSIYSLYWSLINVSYVHFYTAQDYFPVALIVSVWSFNFHEGEYVK